MNYNYKEEYLITNLKLCCYEQTATGETFENTINVCGLTEEILIILISYYGNDYDKQLIKFPRG